MTTRPMDAAAFIKAILAPIAMDEEPALADGFRRRIWNDQRERWDILRRRADAAHHHARAIDTVGSIASILGLDDELTSQRERMAQAAELLAASIDAAIHPPSWNKEHFRAKQRYLKSWCEGIDIGVDRLAHYGRWDAAIAADAARLGIEL